jgi:hypothetical protein
MPTRPDLRDITTGVRDALADSDRDALLEMLTFLIKEYVVDGPPPMLVHQTETIADLNGLSFAQLVTALQTRLDLPELAMFVVDGGQVSVRIGGAMHALVPGRAAPAATELPRPSAGVRVVETTMQQRPASAAPAAPMTPGASVTERAAAPPPARGLSVRGQPSGEGPGAGPGSGPGAASGAQPGAQPPPAAPPSAAPAPSEKSEGGGDDASARFSLLELD